MIAQTKLNSDTTKTKERLRPIQREDVERWAADRVAMLKKHREHLRGWRRQEAGRLQVKLRLLDGIDLQINTSLSPYMEFYKQAEQYAAKRGDDMTFVHWYKRYRELYSVEESTWYALSFLYNDDIANALASGQQ